MIGAGVAACALVAGLRRGGWQGAITLWEAGRGPGGRAATRRSRRDAGLRIDHGAPLLNLVETPAPELVAPLLADGWLVPWREPAAVLGGDGALRPAEADPLLRGVLHRGRNGMDDLCRGLLALAEAEGPSGRLSTRFGTLVRHLEPRTPGGWRLRDGSGATLGEADWLVLSGTLLAHPRAVDLFGWPEVPLRRAAAVLGDPALDAALEAIAALDMEARGNLLLTIEAAAAASWGLCPSGCSVVTGQPSVAGECGGWPSSPWPMDAAPWWSIPVPPSRRLGSIVTVRTGAKPRSWPIWKVHWVPSWLPGSGIPPPPGRGCAGCRIAG